MGTSAILTAIFAIGAMWLKRWLYVSKKTLLYVLASWGCLVELLPQPWLSKVDDVAFLAIKTVAFQMIFIWILSRYENNP